MKRLIDYYLKEWKNDRYRTALLLRGARQVGKTYAVRNLGETYESFVEVNLEKMRKATPIFEQGNLEPKQILKDLSILLNKDIIPGKTLLFIDEIQKVPSAITALRYFYEEIPELHVIGAGSLLDFAIETEGMPVGRVESLYMYPVSFIEFLAATKNYLALKEIMNQEADQPISEVIHNKLLEHLTEYLAIGGMPKAVEVWAETKDFRACAKVHQKIISTYKQDFSKYAKTKQIKYLENVFKSIPRQIGSKFKYTEIEGEFRKRELSPVLDKLEIAGVAHKIVRTSGNGIPLGAETYFDDYKIFLLDIAINQTVLGLKLGEWLLNPLKQFVNRGNFTEAFVGQELLAYSNPFEKEQLYFWRRNVKGSEAEVDYLIQKNQDIIPIEVKSAEGTRLKSMQMFLDLHSNTSSYGIRFSTNNYSIFDKIHSYPLYSIAKTIVENKKSINELLI
ncbi:hypothetical protein A3F66_01725 [candidate division TM6 bacterium RIFCSPHIGHO2_12_FULL_32_22]|nr:MAG: hypothetical protein A3F66_01725 [candidate division TM6 bacterium RIFCSPHIGHO2_12_FULL_32_22]